MLFDLHQTTALWSFLLVHGPGKMKFSESLKKNEDFKKVYNERRSKSDGNLIVYVRENGMDINRLGISISKKKGNSVVRHHFARLEREAYRLHEEMFKSGLDIVVIARIPAKDMDFHQVESSLLRLADLHNVII